MDINKMHENTSYTHKTNIHQAIDSGLEKIKSLISCTTIQIQSLFGHGLSQTNMKLIITVQTSEND